MAKKAAAKTKSGKKSGAKAKGPGGSQKRNAGGRDAGEAFVKLLQSPLVAELVAVAATAALAALAQEGFGGGGATRGKRAGRAVKQAGKAAANAVKQRLTTEIDEIRKAAKSAKA